MIKLSKYNDANILRINSIMNISYKKATNLPDSCVYYSPMFPDVLVLMCYSQCAVFGSCFIGLHNVLISSWLLREKESHHPWMRPCVSPGREKVQVEKCLAR